MSRPVWFVKLIELVFPQRFWVARATRLPILSGLAASMLSEGDDLVYLPRAKEIPVNVALDRPEEVVVPSRVVDQFIERASYHWVMNFCICREGERCKDYPRDLGCLFLGEAVLSINPSMGRRVTKQEALEHVQRCREAGLVHLVGRNKLDVLWLGVSPRRKLLTICNCCPCCCLWRILPHVAPGIGAKVARMPGVSVKVGDTCTGCGACADGVCFVGAIQMQDGRAVIGDACRGCGRCAAMCPAQAIQITVDNPRAVEDTIERIAQGVDLS